jgi:hypothetical protein
MLPAEFIVVAIVLRLLAGASYIVALLQGKARPNLVSWFFWGLTALIAFGVQLYEGAGSSALITLAIGLSPVIVVAVAIAKGQHKAKFTATDKRCAAVTVAGIAVWLVTKDPMTAMFMAIAVDYVSSLPTIVKLYKQPGSERALPYAISIAAMGVALLTVQDWQLSSWLFSAYILFINLHFVTLISTRMGPRIRSWRMQQAKRRQQQPQLLRPAYAEKEL